MFCLYTRVFLIHKSPFICDFGKQSLEKHRFFSSVEKQLTGVVRIPYSESWTLPYGICHYVSWSFFAFLNMTVVQEKYKCLTYSLVHLWTLAAVHWLLQTLFPLVESAHLHDWISNPLPSPHCYPVISDHENLQWLYLDDKNLPQVYVWYLSLDLFKHYSTTLILHAHLQLSTYNMENQHITSLCFSDILCISLLSSGYIKNLSPICCIMAVSSLRAEGYLNGPSTNEWHDTLPWLQSDGKKKRYQFCEISYMVVWKTDRKTVRAG